MKISKLFVYSLMTLSLAFPAMPQAAQAGEYYTRQRGLCCGKFDIASTLRNLNWLREGNVLVATADDLLKAGIYSGGIYLLVRLVDATGALNKSLKTQARVANWRTGLGIVTPFFIGTAAVLGITGLVVDRFSRRHPTYVSDLSHRYLETSEAFSEFLALSVPEQLSVLQDAHESGNPELGLVVAELADTLSLIRAAELAN